MPGPQEEEKEDMTTNHDLNLKYPVKHVGIGVNKNQTTSTSTTFAPMTLKQRDEALLKRTVVTPKIIKLLGDERLLPVKARRFFGDSEPLEPLAPSKRKALEKSLQKALESSRLRSEKMRKKSVDSVLKMKPTQEQLSIPSLEKRKERPLSAKAIKILGDESLEQQSLRILTPQMRKNVKSKTISMFGEPQAMLTPKQQQVFGVGLELESRSSSHSRRYMVNSWSSKLFSLNAAEPLKALLRVF